MIGSIRERLTFVSVPDSPGDCFSCDPDSESQLGGQELIPGCSRILMADGNSPNKKRSQLDRRCQKADKHGGRWDQPAGLLSLYLPRIHLTARRSLFPSRESPLESISELIRSRIDVLRKRVNSNRSRPKRLQRRELQIDLV